VSNTNGGQPLSGVRAAIGAATSITDGAGAFSAQTSPASSMLLQLTGASVVPRTLTVAASTSRDLAVSAIALDAAFDLIFYRQFVVSDAMYGKANNVCDAPLSARERYHAAIAYARPVGNVDPDTDPAGTVNLAPMTVR
jgi:hypothetical protein